MVTVLRNQGERRGGSLRSTVLIGAAALIGLCLATYPSAARWFSAQEQSELVGSYTRASEQLGDEANRAMLERAREYNGMIPRILVNDPYAPGDGNQEPAGAWEEYLSQLSDAGEVMGRIRVPSVAIDLPILHGTDDDTLRRGVGHLFGSSLPVGGERTHSVLTAHNALTEARLFDDLDQVEVGDDIVLTVAGEQLVYRVDQIQVVEPSDISALRLADGEDQVTLVTCTPRAVNSHRLLVRGSRIEVGDGVLDDALAAASGPGFPWWAVWFGSGVLLIVGGTVVLARLDRRPSVASGGSR